ncbi:hypothetical protein ACRRTK_022862 [Alexandromys fortis]
MKTQAGVTLGIQKPHSALIQLCELKGVTDCCEPISVTAKRDPKSGLIKATTKRAGCNSQLLLQHHVCLSAAIVPAIMIMD